MEIHIKAAFDRTANEYLQFNVYTPDQNVYNKPSEEILNFLIDKLPLFNSPFKLLQFIEGQIDWTPKIATMQEKKDFESILMVKLGINEVDEEKLWINDEETYESTINREYIRQLICQKLCELQVFNKEIIFKNGQYILPKPDCNAQDSFAYWYKHFATEEDKNHLTSQEKGNLLFLAVKEGDIDTIRQRIDSGVDVNIQVNDQSLLMLAAKTGHKALVKQLIDNGAHINPHEKDRTAILFWAAAEGLTDFVKQLIDSKANVNIRNNFGKTALELAAEKGQYFTDADYQKNLREFILALSNQGSMSNEIKLELLKKFQEYIVFKWEGMRKSIAIMPSLFLRVVCDSYLNVLNGNPAFKMTVMTDTQKIISNMIDEVEKNISQQDIRKPYAMN